MLLLTDSYRPTVNGVVASIEELHRGLVEAGHEVRVLTVGPTRRTTFDGEVYRLPSLDASHIYPHARLGRPVDRGLFADLVAWRPEILHSHTEFAAFWWARRLANRLTVPHVHTYHTLYADYTHYFFPHERAGRALCARFARGTLNRTDLVIAPTAKIQDLLHGYGVRAPVRVVPTGIDLTRFTPGPGSADLRASLDLAPGVPVVLSLGRLAVEKRTAEVIDLLASVDEPWQLVVAGDGPQAGALRRQVDRLGLTPRVRFVGAIEPTRVPEFYRLADVFVSGSRSETQGLTYLEALASGVPVLCRDDPSVDGVVVDGHNGRRYQTPEEFTRTLRDLLHDAGLRRRWSEGAVQTAAGFGRDTFVDAICAAYDRARGPVGTARWAA
ncbi:glycosyltransferase family 4 protein [Ornithinimicrobium avium]|uniref:D-inositol 3-phosphate glycosyltransferase n=1 Tax=Ornithinimicrobium avium TaxID=2283195 RepID=A0A345NT11_9MICO|nr:glycosyltransferase family 4 protein [Ornithinimicrobium avium]